MTATATTVLDPSITHLELDPTSRLRAVTTTVLAVAAPVLFTVSNVWLPSLTGSTARVVAHVPAVANRLLASHLLYALASLLMIALAVALWRIDVRRGSVLRLVGGVLLIVGGVSNALGEVTDGYLAWGMHRGAVEAAAQVRTLDILDKSSAGLPISFLAIPLLVFGLLLLLAGVLRARVVPAWLPILTVVAALVSGAGGVGPGALLGLGWSAGCAAIVVLVARSEKARP